MPIAYILKRYPRYSETFIVNEILAHEAAGVDIHIFALRPPTDTHFQDKLARVKAPVTYLRKPIQGRNVPALTSLSPNAASYFWAELQEAAQSIPHFWIKLDFAIGEPSSVVYQAVWLAQEIQQRGITHLHAHFGSVATNVARLAAYFADVPYSFTAHAKDIFHDSVNAVDMQRKLRDAAAVITVSDYNVGYLKHQYGEVAQRVQRIYNGIDLGAFPYTPQTSTYPPRILSVCRLVEKKGLSYLIEACSLLRQWGCEFICQIVGSGPLEYDLRSHIQSAHLDDWIEIMGPRPQSEVFDLMRSATVFVAPYIIGSDGNRDGLPTVLLEAMALGTPCVATDVTGIPELIQHQNTGILVNQRNEKQLATAIQQLLAEPELRNQIASRARSLIESNFDIVRNSATLRACFTPQSVIVPMQEV